MGVPLGWPCADGVQIGDERKRLAGDVVAGPEAGEVDVLPGEAQAMKTVGDDVEQKLALGQIRPANHRGLGPPDHCNPAVGVCSHQKIRLTRSASTTSGSSRGTHPTRAPYPEPGTIYASSAG